MHQHRSGKSTRRTRYMRFVASIAVAVMAASVPLVAAQAAPIELPTREVLPFALAQKIADAAIQKAKAIPAAGVIAIVDDAGEVILQIRMDNAFMRASSRLAPEKARSAVMFHRSTATLEAAVAGPRPALVTAPGFVMLKGGEPIVINGHLVGGIGVSVDTPDHDEDIAQAGLAAIK
ncbi:GlcG/HbpS family heme-binding protein [Acetobacter orientalis]|uniref:GlcG/HbpS family heme-binding protein n=1 Tax=Acetobacter orientalis TaxID=146474 RepID=UPI00241E166A|nr:heme-binding protein [Acetobacter orientalis]